MLNSRKGNLSCFQWEVQRFQQSHREKMAAVTPQTNNRPSQPQRQRRKTGLRKRETTRATLAEVDVKRMNGFLVEKLVHIHRIGGFQRRFLNEFQDVKAALQFGKTNVGVSRAAHERRLIQRQKNQELLRRENAKLFTRLASSKRGSIDFNKFEADFAKSREHRRVAQCNRTVGHTSVFSAVKARAPCSGADSTLCGPAPPVKNSPTTRDMRSQQLRKRASPAGLSSDSLPIPGVQNPLSSATNHGGILIPSDVSPRRPHTADRCRQSTKRDRPRTALGLRRGSKHHDLFDARAAGPGWGTVVEKCDGFAAAPRRSGMAGARRPKRPEPKDHTGCRKCQAADSNGDNDDSDDHGHTVSTGGGSADFQTGKEEGGSGGGRLWFLGRTLLAEAKVLIGGSKTYEKQKSGGSGGGGGRGGGRGGRRGGGGGRAGRGGGTKVSLRFLSLDGLIRQRDRVRKTLRGFVVEASLIPPCQNSPSGGSAVEDAGEAGSSGSSRRGSSSVAVSTVQEYLQNFAASAAGDRLGPSSALTPFRDAHPLDECGNFPEINELLGQVGQRDLYQTLLGSCRVVTSHDRWRKINVQLLRVNADGGGVSTYPAVPPGIGVHGPKPRHDHESTAKRGNHIAPSNGTQVGAGRSTGSPTAAKGNVGGAITSREGGDGRDVLNIGGTCASNTNNGDGVSGGPSVTAGREAIEKNTSIVVRVPLAPSRPNDSPKAGSEEGLESGNEEQEDEDGDEDDDNDDNEDEDGNEDESD